jgi:DNA-binding transcriptional LysR family regulator
VDGTWRVAGVQVDEHLDFNLLVTLDALLERGSVKEAAAELGRSMPAVSRSLARIRAAFDDPILVRSGQRLVPTPLALELQSRVHELLNDAAALLKAKKDVDLAILSRGFVIAMTDPLMCSIGTRLIRFLERNAPGIKVSFVVEGPTPLATNGTEVDLEVGVVVSRRPEHHVEDLFDDRLVGIARADHPIFDAPITFDRYLGFKHLLHSRRGAFSTPIDEQLQLVGRTRTVAASAPTLAASLFILTHTDLVGTCLECTTRPMAAELGLRYFDLPLKRRSSPISLVWHRRFDSDVAHRGLRDTIRGFVLSLNDFSEQPDFTKSGFWDDSFGLASTIIEGPSTAVGRRSGPPIENGEAAGSSGP